MPQFFLNVIAKAIVAFKTTCNEFFDRFGDVNKTIPIGRSSSVLAGLSFFFGLVYMIMDLDESKNPAQIITSK